MGYLLVLQAFEDEEDGPGGQIEDYVVRLIALASQKADWELCGELARFLIALDASGEMLRRAISRVGLRNGALQVPGVNGSGTSTSMKGLGLALPMRTPSWSSALSQASSVSPGASADQGPSEATSSKESINSQ